MTRHSTGESVYSRSKKVLLGLVPRRLLLQLDLFRRVVARGDGNGVTLVVASAGVRVGGLVVEVVYERKPVSVRD